MSGALQAVFQNLRSFGPPAIGSAFGGGFFAGQVSTAGNGIADYNLVVGPLSSAAATKQWKTDQTDTPGARSVINGAQNTADIVADGNATLYPAAHFCKNLTIGGFSDWYFAAKNELEICYYNLKPTTTSNDTSSGANTNAVPSRGSNYTAGTPARTAATSFQSGNSEAFPTDYTWSSTKNSASNNWNQYFSNGSQAVGANIFTYQVRAIRKVAV